MHRAADAVFNPPTLPTMSGQALKGALEKFFKLKFVFVTFTCNSKKIVTF